MNIEEVAGIGERIKKSGIGLKDALAVVDMTLRDQITGPAVRSPYDAFMGLNKLIDRTVRGTKIERFKPQRGRPPFHSLEISSERGDVLGYLNMVYLKKLIPCYYLVYVEVLPPFRGRGLGNKVLQTFMTFVEGKKAVGLLDNIIPPEEPTYEIYTKLGWKSVKEYVGDGITNGDGNYMVFVPESIKAPDLSNELVKILFSLRRKRSVIDMHDNEDMVKRSIQEFRSVYEALASLFHTELVSGDSTPLMCFMFTRFTTKLIGFRRRIASLLGYTGGESLEQISLSEQITALPIQPYSPWKLEKDKDGMWGEETILHRFPRKLKEEPTLFVEALPLYRRPYLSGWMERKGNQHCRQLKIYDLLELGFDPTKLREFHNDGVNYVFERLSPRFLPHLERRKRCLMKIDQLTRGMRLHGTAIQTNPPLVIFRDRGNIYSLRRKVEGIHLQEAIDQLRISPYLIKMNGAVGIDRAMIKTVNHIREWLARKLGPGFWDEIEELSYFIPWNSERNMPKILMDASGVSLDTLWIS